MIPSKAFNNGAERMLFIDRLYNLDYNFINNLIIDNKLTEDQMNLLFISINKKLDIKMIELFLNNGANINSVTYNGLSILHLIVRRSTYRDNEMYFIKYLVKQGADPTICCGPIDIITSSYTKHNMYVTAAALAFYNGKFNIGYYLRDAELIYMINNSEIDILQREKMYKTIDDITSNSIIMHQKYKILADELIIQKNTIDNLSNIVQFIQNNQAAIMSEMNEVKNKTRLTSISNNKNADIIGSYMNKTKLIADQIAQMKQK